MLGKIGAAWDNTGKTAQNAGSAGMLGFVVNPVAGNGRGLLVWKCLEKELVRRRISFRVKMTKKPGEAKNLVVLLLKKEEVSKIIAVGGDGTVSEVINGIEEAGKACPFGHIPAGSGNDFARGHSLASDPVVALEHILQDRGNKRIDLFHVNSQIAVNAVGAGFDGEVAKVTNEAGYKRWLNRLRLGMVAYFISVIRVLFTYRPCSVKLKVDDQEIKLDQVWLIAVANIPNYGGGMLICPNAIPDDGKAEVCVVCNVTRWSLLRAFPLIYKGAHVSHPGVQFFQGRRIVIEAEKELIVHADGEVIAATPVTIEVAPQRQVIYL
ncbi:diacylglycerol kinase family lipid kinase [Brevibacillus ruminantium]|uniref:Diacylglycerol kinase family lipid kinase n=1 Tax=Brevibacillus ruminantium TaxID=2950604 RepID=A0ABY4WGF4_9BACL|nr:diacylglycerol kinase family protein [Brevibacillus ruminantium]USG65789.1 diacylglycerol kinase family lipid kinase [Brevibacillus ruminantium]